MANPSSSNDRRITVLPALWPKLQEFADRDDLTVANVVNAILLQNLRPYGGCAASASPTMPDSYFNASTSNVGAGNTQQPDPYHTAEIDSW